MNYNKYIGLPYKENGRSTEGVDCWGLARLFYKHELGIELPSYTELYAGSYDPKVVAAIDYYKDGWEPVANPHPGDLCLFNILGEPAHIGVYIGDQRFIHSRDGLDSVIERLDNFSWKRRLLGFYRYKPTSIIATGKPHPLQWSNTVLEGVRAGTTCSEFASYIIDKYKLGKRLASRLLLTIDGVIVPQEQWNTTTINAGQNINYRVVAEGRQGLRLVLMIAVFVISQDPVIAAKVGAAVGGTAAVGSAIIQIAGTVLINAAFPIRPPEVKDPGQTIGASLFTGSQNQANPFGAIPVVLGRNRVTGVLGATPYIETLTNTNLLHLLIIWGFGPLQVDENTISVGATPLSELHSDKLLYNATEVAYTLGGLTTETQAQADTFNSYYPSDVQQLPASPVELVNNNNDGNPWTLVTFTQPATSIDVAFNFPEGLRAIYTKDGKTDKFNVSLGIEIVPANQVQTNPNLDSTASSNIDYYNLSSSKTEQVDVPQLWVVDENTSYTTYQRFTACLRPNADSLIIFAGAASDTNNSNPSAIYKSYLNSTAYTQLLGTQRDFIFEPQIPSGYLRLYSFTLDSGNNISNQTDHTSAYTTLVKSGFNLSLTQSTKQDYSSGGAETLFLPAFNVTISAGSLTSTTLSSANAVTQLTVFNSRTNFANITNVTRTDDIWHNFLKQYGVWGTADISTSVSFDQQTTFTAPYDGTYLLDFSADDYGQVYIDNVTVGTSTPVVSVSKNFRSFITKEVYLSAGTHTIRVTATSAQAVGSTAQSSAGIACVIRFVYDGVQNVLPTRGYKIITISRNYKDAFNYVYKLENIPRNTYAVRVKRITNDDPEQIVDWRVASRVSLQVVSAYDSIDNPPLKPLPKRKLRNNSGTVIAEEPRNLARTAIKVQSTNKVNGTLQGINAMVQTIAKINIASNGTYTYGATNNPASLFVHVLQHTANSYSVNDSEIDWPTIASWYNFCNANPSAEYKVNYNQPILAYNNVISSTQNLMELLRDICAAGMASPTYVNGKWSVVIDRLRSHTIQHFTPHNSWGFESTKTLVRIPDAFRIAFANETKAYQADEIIVYNYGYGETDGYVVTSGSFVSGRTYKITKLGTTTQQQWNTAAGTSGVVYVVGDTFVAAASGSGNGQAFTTQGTSGRAVKGAEIFEQLTLPGVTNPDQIRYFASWHLAQLKLRPETYSLNSDFEYLVCTRGDLVKVTHDVPRWGVGSARVKNISGNTITLTEPVLLDSTKSYSITIRTNALTTTEGSGSVTRAIQNVGTSNYYTTVTTTTSFTGVEVDNLVMIGENNSVSQDLIVLSVEPTSNVSARLVLADYSPDIYTKDLDNEYIHFNSNITLQNTDIVKNTIVKAPKVTNVSSNTYYSTEISNGNYANTTIISFSNPTDLTANTTHVQLQVIESNSVFNDLDPQNTYLVNKDTGSLTVVGLKTGYTYKTRARYSNSTASVFGPWSDEQIFYVDGKSNNPFAVTDVAITLQGTNIIVKPIITGTEPANHKTYVFRLYRTTSSGSADFWTTSWDSTNMLEIQSRTQAVFNLLNLPRDTGRISSSGVNYRIACRALDNTDVYSTTSAVGSIKIQTLQ